MVKKAKRSAGRVRRLIISCTLSAIILGVSTYAWFVGMRTVSVDPFEIQIASTESLLLSLNGERWDNVVTITEDNFISASYINNTNSWGGSGLVPMSTIGIMDVTSSRLKLYEKGSLTPTAGGYRLLASQVNNSGPSEKDGYVAFDLFIKNISGTQYIEALNELDEEAIYLTLDSEVKVGNGGVPNTGIENSVRVAFGQIGRVIGTSTDVAKITGIKCDPNNQGSISTKDGVTGICRTAQIWEPNDEDHVSSAIGWYNTSCRKRTGESTYGAVGSCKSIADENAYQTYAVKEPISALDKVDVYDGADYNEYAGTTKLFAFPYFTDTDKEKTGTARPLFMTLAPNSITKVRVYVYIEGQDVDNYDFASIGKKISVSFGFTKERLVAGDTGYVGPSLDVMEPIITLTGDNPQIIAVGGEYTELGATAMDDKDGDVTEDIVIDTSDVNVNEAGEYTVTYNVSDSTGNVARTVSRTVIVQ